MRIVYLTLIYIVALALNNTMSNYLDFNQDICTVNSVEETPYECSRACYSYVTQMVVSGRSFSVNSYCVDDPHCVTLHREVFTAKNSYFCLGVEIDSQTHWRFTSGLSYKDTLMYIGLDLAMLLVLFTLLIRTKRKNASDDSALNASALNASALNASDVLANNV